MDAIGNQVTLDPAPARACWLRAWRIFHELLQRCGRRMAISVLDMFDEWTKKPTSARGAENPALVPMNECCDTARIEPIGAVRPRQPTFAADEII
jgi:hypothetical protein